MLYYARIDISEGFDPTKSNDGNEFFCNTVYRRKAFSLISSTDHCQRYQPLRISNIPQAWIKPAQNLSSGLVK